MKLQLIRNATMKIEYNGKSFLTDPMLSAKFDIESFGGNSRNPTIDLPMSIEEILFGVDAVISSHTHQDHFDTAAMNIIPSDMAILCQPGDAEKFKSNKFSSVNPVHESTIFSEISIIRTMGHHGTGEIEKAMGKVSGYVLKAKNEPIVYWTGDTIYCDEVKKNISIHKPDYIIIHSCGATLDDSGPIIMDAEQTIELCKDTGDAVVIAVHMEALDHATVTRDHLRSLADTEGVSRKKLVIPDDGESLSFNI